jgi:hypothetical protein
MRRIGYKEEMGYKYKRGYETSNWEVTKGAD